MHQVHALCHPCTLQVERLQHKFSLIHSTLAQQATLQAAPAGVKQSDLTERLSLMSLSDSARYGCIANQYTNQTAGFVNTVPCMLACTHAYCVCALCCSLCNLGKFRMPSSGPSPAAADRDARGPRDKNGGSGGGASAAPSSNGSSSVPPKQHVNLPQAPAGSLAAAAAAAAGGSSGSNGSLRSLGQQAAASQAAGGKGVSRGDASLMGGDGSPLTKGVKAHAVMLSQSALSVNM